MNINDFERSLSDAHKLRLLLDRSLEIQHENNSLKLLLSTGNENHSHGSQVVIPADLAVRAPQKITGIVRSKLGLNTRIFARNCEIKRIEKRPAESFLDAYHLMGSTSSATNYGLFYKSELIAVASFSNGRKMNRLKADQRSFELIRFCSKPGITVTGGLTKLVKNFCEEKKAGDVMTYIDKQLSDGTSFIRAGFKINGETEPNYFLVNRESFERTPAKKEEEFDREHFYLSHNLGNIKLIYTPGKV